MALGKYTKVASVVKAWNRIDAWFATQIPPDLTPLPCGATDGELRIADLAIRHYLPADLKTSLQIHNGTSRWSFSVGRLLSVQEVVQIWDAKMSSLSGGYLMTPKPHGPIRRVGWDARWIPITDNWEGDYLAIDLAPLPGGKKGQVIWITHESGATRVAFADLTAYLESLANDLEKGAYVMDKTEWSLSLKKRRIRLP